MADYEMEDFEITDHDLQNEFGSGQTKRRMTKEQQIYGIWADNSDGEEVASEVGSGSRKNTLNKGMSFVSGGMEQSGEKSDKAEDESSTPMLSKQYDSSDDEEQVSKPVARSLGNSQNKAEIAGMRKRGRVVHKEGGVGNWEKHTTGIGSKLMKMMGYKEGMGLGKNLQGRSTPVEANKRRGKGAIGFYGEETRKVIPQHDSEGEEKSKFEEQLKQWRKTGSKKKITYVYKSAQEAIKDGKTKIHRPDSDTHITKTKVIDMTGPETRVLSSYHAIAGQKTILHEYEETKSRTYEHFDIPELIQNIQFLLEKSEEDIVRNAKEMEQAENRIVHLNHERERYDVLLDRQGHEMKSMNEASEIINQLEEKHKQKILTLDEAESLFSELKTQYSQIYYSYEFPYLAPAYVTQLLKEHLAGWSPLESPTEHLHTMNTWQELLQLNNDQTPHQPPDEKMDPYQKMVWEVWTPYVRSAMFGWNPKETEPIVTFVETWRPPVIPNWIMSHLLQGVILPRITEAVNVWNPMVDIVAIHTWIHPWLPWLSEQLQSVYPVIRKKLSTALIHWHPSDDTAKKVLQPWKRVFSDISMTTLIQNNIQPKLEGALLEMPISPHNQSLQPWFWFTDWQDMLPVQIVVDVLKKCFIPRWYQAIAVWLSANPPYMEVVAWYKGWRDLMPAKAAAHLEIKQKFQEILEICRRALSFQPGATEQFNLLLSGLEKISDPPPPPPIGSPPKQQTKDWAKIIRSATRESTSMRDLVEVKCHEQGIVFIPLPDRNHEGRPVYRCGRLTISLNKNIIYVHTERGWTPKSLKVLLDAA